MIVTSKTRISNMALGGVGVTARLDDVDNETSTEAYNCRLYFDQVVGEVLEAKPWPFATKRWTLSSVGSPPDDWKFRYKYPVDCALAVKIINPYQRTPGTDKKIPFRVMQLGDAYGKAILTDMENAILEGNVNITDPNYFPWAFQQAVVMGLSSYIGMPLRVDPKIASYASEQYSNWLSEAANHSLREGQEDPEPASEFETARS